MDAVISQGPDAIEQVADQWRALWNDDPAATPFHRPEYVGIWMQEFAGRQTPIVVTVTDDGAPAGVVALTIDDDQVLRFCGDPDVTDYFGPIGSPSRREEVADAILRAIAELDGWRTAALGGLAGDSGWPEAIERAAKNAGFAVDVRQQDVTPRIALGGSYDDYFAALDSKKRHEIKRKARKLERDTGGYDIRLVTGHDVHRDLEMFFDMHRSSEGPKGHFLHWGMAGWFILLARTLADEGWLRLSFLDVDGRPLAGVFSYYARGVWGAYNAAYDHEKRELGAGSVLMAETIRLACEEGAHTFDLLRGDEAYKYRLGAIDTPLQLVTVERI